MCIKKRISVLCLCLILSLGTSACNGAENSTVNPNAFKEESAARSDRDQFKTGSPNTDIVVDESPADPPADGADKKDSLAFKARYIRTDGYREGADFPQVYLINNTEELQAYYDANKETFQLETSRPADGEAQDFLSLCSGYNDDFFKNQYLLFILVEEGSGSIRHKVSDVYISNQTSSSSDIDTSEPKLTVCIEPIIPEVGTCDMAEWHIIIELNRSTQIQESSGVDVYYADRLVSGNNVSEDVFNSREVRKTPPELKIITPNESKDGLPIDKGAYIWSYTTEEGTVSAVTVDALHPLQANLKAINLKYNEFKLAFEEEPDSFTVRTWPQKHIGEADPGAIPPEIINVNTYPLITLKEGGYICEITAVWNENVRPYYGEVSYCFYGIVESES